MGILAIDVGGTKTHIGVFGEDGKLGTNVRFSTPQNYTEFLQILKTYVDELGHNVSNEAGCIGLPGVVDRVQGIFLTPTNLPNWINAPVGSDIASLLDIRTVIVENDANLAALAEAKDLDAEIYRRVAYITIGTGIGIGVIFDGKLVPDLVDAEAGELVIYYDGNYAYWEDIASGKALSSEFGLSLEEMADEDHRWHDAGEKFGIGVVSCAALYNELDAVIFGGGVGQRFNCYKQALRSFVDTHTRGVKTPALFPSKMPETASLYGGFYHIKNYLELG